MTDLDRSTALIHDIAKRIVNDENYLALDWEALALVVTLTTSSASMYGFAYLDGGEIVPEYPADRDITNLFAELQDATAKPDGTSWVAMLIQIVRATGQMHIEYDWQDPDRWKVTPATLEARREELRPVAEATHQ